MRRANKPHLYRGQRSVNYRLVPGFEWRCVISTSLTGVVLGVGKTPLLAYQHAKVNLAEWEALERDAATMAVMR